MSFRFQWDIESYTLWAVDKGRVLNPPVHLPLPVPVRDTDYTAVAKFYHGDEGVDASANESSSR